MTQETQDNGIPSDQRPASYSTLLRMKRSPAHCKEYLDNPPEPTKPMIFGKLFHTLLLEPDQVQERYHVAADTDPATPRKQIVLDMIDAIMEEKFDDRFFLDEGNVPKKPTGKAAQLLDHMRGGASFDLFKHPPECGKRSAADKQRHQEFEQEAEQNGWIICDQDKFETAAEYFTFEQKVDGREIVKLEDLRTAKNYSEYLKIIGNKEIVKQEDIDTAQAMCESIRRHPTASKLLNGEPEKKIEWTDNDAAYPCKVRMDLLNNDGYVLDIKSAEDASESEFSRSVAKYGYHIQQAMTVDGYEANYGDYPKAFLFIVVEKKPPHAVGVYALDQAGEDQGREEYKDLLSKYAACQQLDTWPAYSDYVQTVELPRWYGK